MDIETELPKLKSRLSKTCSTLERLTIEDKQNILRDTQSEGQNIEDRERGLKEMAGRLQTLQKELTILTNAVDTQLHEKELVSEELEHAHHSIHKEQGLQEGQERTVDDTLKQLNKIAELFRDRLGLSFKKTTGDRLQMVFTHIDHSDPENPFYFFVKVDKGKYVISGCEPAIPDLDSLVEKLNSTNNLRSFVVAVRKRFKKLV